MSEQVASFLIFVPGPSYLLFLVSKMYGKSMKRSRTGLVWALVSSFAASLLGVFGAFFSAMLLMQMFGGGASIYVAFSLTMLALGYLFGMAWPLVVFVAAWIVGLFIGAKTNAHEATVGEGGGAEQAKHGYLEGK